MARLKSRYRNIMCLIWNDDKFPHTSDDCQLVFFHLLTTPMGTPFGCFKAGMAGLAEEKRWPIDRYRNAFQEALGHSFVNYDDKARVVLITNFLKYNAPQSPNVVTSWSKVYSELPDCALKREFLRSLESLCIEMGKAFSETFREAFGKALEEASAESFAKDIPNQEQEQKQEHKQEHTSARSTSAERADPPSDDQSPMIASVPTNQDPPDGAAIHKFKSGRWFWGTEDDLDMATHIHDCVMTKFPETKEPNLAVWANDVRLMRTADDRDSSHIRALWDWAHADEGDGKWPGWSVNVRSPDKLRAKWTDLAIRRKEEKQRSGNGEATGKRKSAFERLEDDLARDQEPAGTAGRVIDLPEGPDGFSLAGNDRPIRGVVD